MFFASFHQRNRNLAFVDFDTSVLSNIPNKVFASVRGLLLHYMYASEDIHLSCLKADLREVTENFFLSLCIYLAFLYSPLPVRGSTCPTLRCAGSHFAP